VTHPVRPLSARATKYDVLLRVFLVLIFFMSATPSSGQRARQWTERENLGLKGPVRSVATTVTKINPDPRPKTRRKLHVEGRPDWEVFDLAGRQIEYASASTPEGVIAITRCTYRGDGSRVCKGSDGKQQESREQRTIFPDGSQETTYFLGSKVLSRQVTQFDEKGRAVAVRAYRSDGKLNSVELKLPNGDDESKIYDDSGTVVFDERTHTTDDQNRFDRWFYDSEGHLVWNLALSRDGELLSYWYKIGFKSKLSSSDSLGVCRPRLCVDYKFDEDGSGRLEKVVQHTEGEGNLEPDSEEHYNFDGILDERVEIKYVRDEHGNWTSRSVSVWDPDSNIMVEVEQDTRAIKYY
jgi:hypothetical protein